VKIVWTGPALSDLQSIRDYIARDSAFYAARFIKRLIRSVRVLERSPEIGAVVPEFQAEGIREILFRNYRILYRIRADRVRVIAVVHAARDLGSLERKSWDVF
jgi:toxin ParE1/3/4